MIIVYCIAGVLGLILLFIIIGFFLPKVHQLTVETTLAVSPDRVWEIVADEMKASDWRSDIAKVEIIAEGGDIYSWKEMHNNGMAISFVLVEKTPLSKIERRIVGNRNFGGSWVITLHGNEQQTTIAITESGEIYNPFFRFMSLFMDKSASIKKYLDDLKKVV